MLIFSFRYGLVFPNKFFRVFIIFHILNINNSEEMQDTSRFIFFFKNGTNSHGLLFFSHIDVQVVN